MPALIATPTDTPCRQPRPVRMLRLRTLIASLWAAISLLHGNLAHAQQPAATQPDAFKNSKMDQSIFQQLLIGELQANGTAPGSAYDTYLALARKQHNPELFKRAINLGLHAQSLDQALKAAKAWRRAQPKSREAAEYQVQILLLMGRNSELAEPITASIQLAPVQQQAELIAGLPRSLSRVADRQAAALVIDEVTKPWRTNAPALPEAWVASGEAWLAAKDNARAFEAAQKAHSLQPQSLGAGLLALNLMDTQPLAEALIRRQLSQSNASTLLRLAFARKLAAMQRMSDAAQQLETIISAKPDDAGAWLTLAAVQLEQQRTEQAEVSLHKFIALKTPSSTQNPSPTHTTSGVAPQATPVLADTSIEPAYLLMSQLEEQRSQWQKALDWLQRLSKTDTLQVQSTRGRLLAKQGKLDEGRAAIRSVVESEPHDALTKYQAEAQLLREMNLWDEARQVMIEANQRFPDDADLLYEQAMLSEHLQKFDEMEVLLRKSIQLKPDSPNAYNALGYSLADRNVRLPEARTLIDKALTLRPGDPFITDSLGWLEFRSARVPEALALLRQAYKDRQDPEIAAHLGEVLWSQGERDEAIRIWRKAKAKDAKNAALIDALKRLNVEL